MYYTAEDGRQILDGTAGLWCVNAGHAHPKITEQIIAQAKTMDFAPPFKWDMQRPLKLLQLSLTWRRTD